MMQDLLTKYTLLAKHVIYDPKRMAVLANMLNTPDGAVLAVKTVMGAIEQAKPIPPQLAKSLAVNCYLIMVEVMQDATKKEASPNVMKKVIGTILMATDLTHPEQAATDATHPVQQSAPQGIINQAQGVPA